MQMNAKKRILPQKDRQTFSSFVSFLSKLKARFLSDARQLWGLLPFDMPWRSAQICGVFSLTEKISSKLGTNKKMAFA